MTNIKESMAEMKRALGLFDVINLVIGTIVGADIYIAAAFGAGILGPASLLAWVLAGVMALLIALCFAECSSLTPRVGGPYAYAREAFGDFTGFMVGWSLIIASWAAIAVFPLALVAYLTYFLPHIAPWQQDIIKIAFVLFLTFINYRGVKEAGKINDALTVLKIFPLVILTLLGLVFFLLQPSLLISNLTPFAPLGWSGLGGALVLIFWAYVGFELVTVPSDEIQDAKRTIPRALVLGMALIMVFYFLTNFVIMGSVPWQELSSSSAPLALAGKAIIGSLGAIILAIGALFSISGSDEAGILSSARIPYAMAGDGLFPHFFARLHPVYGTPYLALGVQGAVTIIATLLGTISELIILSVFTLLLCYLVTCLAVFPLRKKYEGGINLPRMVPILGVIISIYLMTQCSPIQILTGVILMLLGIPVYIKYSPGEEIKSVRREIKEGKGFFARELRLRERFLAHTLGHLASLVRRIR